jgi:hypothetical protein
MNLFPMFDSMPEQEIVDCLLRKGEANVAVEGCASYSPSGGSSDVDSRRDKRLDPSAKASRIDSVDGLRVINRASATICGCLRAM